MDQQPPDRPSTPAPPRDPETPPEQDWSPQHPSPLSQRYSPLSQRATPRGSPLSTSPVRRRRGSGIGFHEPPPGWVPGSNTLPITMPKSRRSSSGNEDVTTISRFEPPYDFSQDIPPDSKKLKGKYFRNQYQLAGAQANPARRHEFTLQDGRAWGWGDYQEWAGKEIKRELEAIESQHGSEVSRTVKVPAWFNTWLRDPEAALRIGSSQQL